MSTGAVANDAAAPSVAEGAAADAESDKKENKDPPIKIIPAVKKPEPPKDPNKPTDRDVIMDQEEMQGTAMLFDLIRFHYYLWFVDNEGGGHSGGTMTTNSDDRKKGEPLPTDPSQVEDLTKRLVEVMSNGKQYCLLGLIDVPQPYLVGEGRYFKKDPKSPGEHIRVDDEKEIHNYVATTILAQFKALSQSPPSQKVIDAVKTLYKNTDPANKKAGEVDAGPRPVDVLLVPTDAHQDDVGAYEEQTGNKRLLHLASTLVSGGELTESENRIVAAVCLTTSKVDVEELDGTISQKTPRFILQTVPKDAPKTHSWRELDYMEMAELTTMFVFEIFREKRLNDPFVVARTCAAPMVGLSDLEASDDNSRDGVPPGTEGIEHPTTHDVLFGRGGMTNGHPGNRRFRDIIALHRPDYMGATKTQKPNVARRIVCAIRRGNPMGRFLKKCDDGLWRDVGDKVAAEKTSQGLRERSNAEKRRRSIERRQGEKATTESGTPASKRSKKTSNDPTSEYLNGPIPDFGTAIPLSLSMKPIGVTGSELKDEEVDESLPPLAKDKDGKILVTKYDVLFGRGGLTNHHKGNKTFRHHVNLHRPTYIQSSKMQKPAVARMIVKAILNHPECPGRFLRKNENGEWVDVGEKKAAEKTSQALREKPHSTLKNDETPDGTPSSKTDNAADAAGPELSENVAKTENDGTSADSAVTVHESIRAEV